MAYTTETDKIRERVRPFIGNQPGLDLGCRDIVISPLAIGIDIYKQSKAANIFGDAGNLSKLVPGKTFPWIFSSHLLEHLIKHPSETVEEWLKFVEFDGYLILYLPDINYYKEQNPDHHWNFTSEQWFEALKEQNIIVYEKRNPTTKHCDEYRVLIVIQKNYLS